MRNGADRVQPKCARAQSKFSPGAIQVCLGEIKCTWVKIKCAIQVYLGTNQVRLRRNPNSPPAHPPRIKCSLGATRVPHLRLSITIHLPPHNHYPTIVTSLLLQLLHHRSPSPLFTPSLYHRIFKHSLSLPLSPLHLGPHGHQKMW